MADETFVTAYTFKLRPALEQQQLLLSWQPMLRAFRNFSLAERIDSYALSFHHGNACDLRHRAEFCPLACSVVRSASGGDPWKPARIATKDCKRANKGDLLPPAKRSAYEMHSSRIATLRRERPWYGQLNFDVMQQELRKLNQSFENFFKGRARFPRFRRTHEMSFEFKPGTVKFEGNRLYLPSVGWMRYYRSRRLPVNAVVKTATVSKAADGWYVSVQLELPKSPYRQPKSLASVETVNGVDRGIIKVVAEASGHVTPNPQIAPKLARRLAIRQRRVSRKKKGSRNRAKAGVAVAKVHQRIARRREDFQWKEAKRIANTADVVGFEALNIAGMKRRCRPQKDESGGFARNGQQAKSALNKAISDAAWGKLLQKVKHQAQKVGARVVEVSARWSSQECSVCGYTSPTNRSGEKFVCESCGHHADADVQAGWNIARRAAVAIGVTEYRVPVVNRELMPCSEVTERANSSGHIAAEVRGAGEPNQKEEYEPVAVQLNLLVDLLGNPPP